MPDTSAHAIYSELAKVGQGITTLSVGVSVIDSVTGALRYINEYAPAFTVLLAFMGFLLKAYYLRKDSRYLRRIQGERRRDLREEI